MIQSKFKKIMLVTTESVNTMAPEQTALRLAERTGAKIILVDSVRTPFHLPRATNASTDRMIEVAVKVKQDYLESIAGQCRIRGIDVESTVLLSARTSEEIVGLAQATNCDLVIRYFKGEQSRVQSRFGQTARNLMRACPVPLLLVGDQVISNPSVLACINADHGIEENQSILDATRQLARSNEKTSAIYCWDIDVSSYLAEKSEERVYTLLPEETQEIFQQIRADLEDKCDLSGIGDQVQIESGDPIRLIPKHCLQHSIDVAVMSSASLNHPLGRLMGGTIEGLIEQLPCALLVVKPIGFKSPVAPAEIQASGGIEMP